MLFKAELPIASSLPSSLQCKMLVDTYFHVIWKLFHQEIVSHARHKNLCTDHHWQMTPHTCLHWDTETPASTNVPVSKALPLVSLYPTLPPPHLPFRTLVSYVLWLAYAQSPVKWLPHASPNRYSTSTTHPLGLLTCSIQMCGHTSNPFRNWESKCETSFAQKRACV